MTFASKAAAQAFIDAIPFREARWYSKGRLMPVQFVVEHTMESSEHSLMAENWQAMTATQDRKSSVNFGVDDNSTRAAVRVTDTAYHVGYGNRNTVGIEHAARAAQTPAEWADPFSDRMLRTQSAPLTAALCCLFDIPIRRATTEDYMASRPDLGGTGWHESRRGILGHVDVARAIQRFELPDSGHTDPGDAWPWDWYLDEVRSHLEDDTMTPAQFLALLNDKHVAARLGKIIDNQIVERIGQLDDGITPTVKNAVADALVENLKRELIKPKP